MIINNGNWVVKLYNNLGILAGSESGSLSNSHSSYGYIYLGLDDLDGWEDQTGHIDNISVKKMTENFVDPSVDNVEKRDK